MAAGRRRLDPLSAVTWVNLNGTVDPDNGAVTDRTNLAITQFTSIATVPQIPARFWGGTQDNGTVRKSTASNTWFDVASGDGGQVLVDHTRPARACPRFRQRASSTAPTSGSRRTG